MTSLRSPVFGGTSSLWLGVHALGSFEKLRSREAERGRDTKKYGVLGP
jgi:hypothetical protein